MAELDERLSRDCRRVLREEPLVGSAYLEGHFDQVVNGSGGTPSAQIRVPPLFTFGSGSPYNQSSTSVCQATAVFAARRNLNGS